MRNYIFVFFCMLFFSLCLMPSCAKEGGNSEKIRDSVYVYSLGEPVYVFDFIGQNRYAYCPSAIIREDGKADVFFCGTPTPDICIDNIYYIVDNRNGTHSTERNVLQPSLSWDSHHNCDPSVIEGQFLYNETTYRYAMFFLSTPLDRYYNEVGVAFSNDLTTWIKYPQQIVKKTWMGDEDFPLGSGNLAWGCGQPSAVSLDKKGKVLLTYTIGDISGTRVVWSIFDMADMSKMEYTIPEKIPVDGLMNLDETSKDYTCNCDFALCPEENKILMIRPVHPHAVDYPTKIPSVEELCYMDYDKFLSGKGKWSRMVRLEQDATHFPRNHNSCILRDSFGHLKDWHHPVVYYTISQAEPQVTGGLQAEWTYTIYSVPVRSSFRYYYRKKIK